MNATLHSRHSAQSTASAIFHSPLNWLQRWMPSAPRAAAASAKQQVQQVHQVHLLEAGNTIEVPQPLQHEVVCLKGRLWITHDHLQSDTVVERGQRYRAGSGSRMLVHAMDDARLMVKPLQA